MDSNDGATRNGCILVNRAAWAAIKDLERLYDIDISGHVGMKISFNIPEFRANANVWNSPPVLRIPCNLTDDAKEMGFLYLGDRPSPRSPPWPNKEEPIRPLGASPIVV